MIETRSRTTAVSKSNTRRIYLSVPMVSRHIVLDMPVGSTVRNLRQYLEGRSNWPVQEMLLKVVCGGKTVYRLYFNDVLLSKFNKAVFSLEYYSSSDDIKFDLEYYNSLLLNGHLDAAVDNLHQTEVVPSRKVPWSPFTVDICGLLVKFIEFCRKFHQESTSADVKFVLNREHLAMLCGQDVRRIIFEVFPLSKKVVLSYMRANCGPVLIQNGKTFTEVPLNDQDDYTGGKRLVIHNQELYACSNKLPGTMLDIRSGLVYGRTNITSGVYYSLYIVADQQDINVHCSSKSIVYYCTDSVFDKFCLSLIK